MCRETIGCDLILSNRVLRDVLDRTAYDVVVSIYTVNGYVPAASELTGRGDAYRIRFGRIEIRRWTIAWNQKRQLEKIPTVKR